MKKNKNFPLIGLLVFILGVFFQPGSASYIPFINARANLQPADTFTVCMSTCPYTSIQAAIEAAGPGDTIQLADETFTEAITINQDVSIIGAGLQETIIQAAPDITTATSRVITVTNGTTTSVAGVTIRNGSATDNGGSILNHGNLTITDALITDNEAENGGGIANISEIGSATLTISNTTIANNEAFTSGGGIMNLALQTGQTSQIILTNSTLTSNSAGDEGGGGILNKATAGTASTEIKNITIYDNNAEGGGGGILNIQETGSANMNIQQTTISNNGNNLYLPSGTIQIAQSILADSIGADCTNITGTLTDNGFNLVEDGSCNFPIGGDPKLNFLADNGGSTQTNALQSDSPALDQIPPQACNSATDQRGMERPFGAGCDIGAFELREQGINFSQIVNDYNVIPGQLITFTVDIEPIGPGISNGTIFGQMSEELTFQPPVLLVPANFGSVGTAPPTLVHSLIISANYTATMTMQAQVVTGLPAGTELYNQVSIISNEIITPVVTTAILNVINVPPVAVDDSGLGYMTTPDSAFITGNVMDNDYDLNGDTIIYLSSTPGDLLGSITELDDKGTFIYNPGYAFEDLPPGATAYDSFSYSITDGIGGIVYGTVTITIHNSESNIFLPLVIK